MTARQSHTGRFRAMDTEIELVGVGVREREHRAATRQAAEATHAWERLFSRFDPASTLSRVNAAGGRITPVEPVFLEVLRRAKQAVTDTDGRFDPAILPWLERLGYDRTFSRIGDTPGAEAPPQPDPAASWSAVTVDDERGTVHLPVGMRLDFGGIAKGAFVDRFARELAAWPGGCLNAGGDMLLWGEPPDGVSWQVGIEDPATPGRSLMSLAIEPGAGTGVATSGTNRRRWMVDGELRHHLVDPATGRPAESPLATVTVVAASATDAEIAAKALLIACTGAAPPRLVHGDLAVLADQHGGVRIIESGDCHADLAIA